MVTYVRNVAVNEEYLLEVEQEGALPRGGLIHPAIVNIQDLLDEEMSAIRDEFGKDEDDWFHLTVHEYDTFGTDGALYDILVYGQSDFGFGASLGVRIEDQLAEAGYFLEHLHGGIFRIVPAL